MLETIINNLIIAFYKYAYSKEYIGTISSNNKVKLISR